MQTDKETKCPAKGANICLAASSVASLGNCTLEEIVPGHTHRLSDVHRGKKTAQTCSLSAICSGDLGQPEDTTIGDYLR